MPNDLLDLFCYFYFKPKLTLRTQGITYEKITATLREKGYSGSVAALRIMYGRNNFDLLRSIIIYLIF